MVLLAGGNIALKDVIFPLILLRLRARTDYHREVEPFVGFVASILFGIVALAVSLWLALALQPGLHQTPFPMLGAAIFLISIGLLIIISRSKALMQVIGYLVLDNGFFVFGVIAVVSTPLLVELGVLLDTFARCMPGSSSRDIFRFNCHGERVLHLEISLVYQHRGVEAALRGGPDKRSIHLAETVAGDTSVGHPSRIANSSKRCPGPAAPSATLGAHRPSYRRSRSARRRCWPVATSNSSPICTTLTERDPGIVRSCGKSQKSGR